MTAVDFNILNKSEPTHLYNTNIYVCIYIFMCMYTHTLMEEEGWFFFIFSLFFSKTLILLINVELTKELYIHYFTRTLTAID